MTVLVKIKYNKSKNKSTWKWIHESDWIQMVRMKVLLHNVIK